MNTTRAIPAEMFEFLNSLPITLHLEDWIVAFRTVLQQFLGDVDRILVVPNTACRMDDPSGYRPGWSITQRVVDGKPVEGPDIVTSELDLDTPMSVKIIEESRRLNFPFHLYQDPHGFEYFYKGTAYLGSIILFREKDQRPISAETLELMESFRPFLVFMLSDALARHHYAKPVDRVYYQALVHMGEDARLTMQDRKIIAHLLLGYSYKETADHLGIKLDTVKKHVKRIHQRTGVRSQGELFAMYFTARMGLKKPDDTLD